VRGPANGDAVTSFGAATLRALGFNQKRAPSYTSGGGEQGEGGTEKKTPTSNFALFCTAVG